MTVLILETLPPPKTSIRRSTALEDNCSTLLSIDDNSGSVQFASTELLYPTISSSLGTLIPCLYANFTAPTASESSDVSIASMVHFFHK